MSYEDEQDEEHTIRQLRLREAALRAETARLRYLREREEMRPSLMVYTITRRQGGNWMCIHPSSEDETECIVAYGESPDQAMRNFDALFMGVGLQLDPQDPDNNPDSELEEM